MTQKFTPGPFAGFANYTIIPSFEDWSISLAKQYDVDIYELYRIMDTFIFEKINERDPKESFRAEYGSFLMDLYHYGLRRRWLEDKLAIYFEKLKNIGLVVGIHDIEIDSNDVWLQPREFDIELD